MKHHLPRPVGQVLDQSQQQQKREEYFQSWDDSKFVQDQTLFDFYSDLTVGVVVGDVLDLGCGSRIYYNTSLVNRWVGIDLSHLLLDQMQFISGAPPKGSIETAEGSCDDLPYPDNSFDFVCATFVLHHLGRVSRKKSLVTVLKVFFEAQRVLKPGGSMIILETWPLFPLLVYRWMFPLLYWLAHAALNVELPYFLTARDLKKLAAKSGMEQKYALSTGLYGQNSNPVLGVVFPEWLQKMLHKFGYYHFKNIEK